MTLLLVLFILSGAVLVILSFPLMMGSIPPNGLYGFRVRRTLEDPVIWYRVNRYSGRLGLALGLILVLAAAVLYFLPGIGIEAFAWSYLAIVVIGIGLLLVLSFRYLKTLS